MFFEVSFQEPENGELWSTEKRIGSSVAMTPMSANLQLQQQMPPPLPSKSHYNASSPYQQQSPNFVKQETTVKAQVSAGLVRM
jgi:hypothetical protein